jgi:RNA-directed DNA polymerase
MGATPGNGRGLPDYRSIPHFKLIQDIKKYYDDPKLLTMLEEIIINPIDTPYGYKNPVHGIALRGPLSQFFSGIYLKPLDDAFDEMDVTYIRYQDDILILCQTKRQLNRARQRMMEVLHERRLSLSRKTSRMGHIGRGFHFLGIDYLPTQTEDCTNATHANDAIISPNNVHYLNEYGGGVRQLLSINRMSQYALFRIREHCGKHARTLNPWSPMGCLPKRSDVIFIALLRGGQ